MSCLLCATYYFKPRLPTAMADKTYSFQGLSFSDQYCKQKLLDVLLLYTNLIGINVIIIIIIIKKSIRLCIDPRDLNEVLEREPYYSRTIDELISMFAGAKVFTIVDMDKGYWQVVLHPESRKLTCMAFDIGRYQFKRLPMGSSFASDIFQRMLDSVYIGLPGVTGIADDMMIFGRNEEEHDRNLILFLETTRKNGLILNKRKLQFKKEEVSFFGHRWNSTGISPDPKKTESILKMQFPPDKETMHSFLGLVDFLN